VNRDIIVTLHFHLPSSGAFAGTALLALRTNESRPGVFQIVAKASRGPVLNLFLFRPPPGLSRGMPSLAASLGVVCKQRPRRLAYSC
jgi:hypothetical protein